MDDKTIINLIISAMVSSTVTAIINNLINFNPWIIFVIVLIFVSIIIFRYSNVSELQNRVSNKLQNNTNLIGIILTVAFLIIFLFSPFYLNHYVLLVFLIPIILFFTYPRFSGYFKYISIVMVILFTLLFIYFIIAYFNVYPNLFDLYLNGYLDKIPIANTISNYKINYIILCIYSIINMILVYLAFKPKS